MWFFVLLFFCVCVFVFFFFFFFGGGGGGGCSWDAAIIFRNIRFALRPVSLSKRHLNAYCHRTFTYLMGK